MLKRSLAYLLSDTVAYWVLKQIRSRAERQGAFSQPFAVPMNDLIGQRLIATGHFELTQLDAVDQLLGDAKPLVGFRPDFAGAFIDVGANIGVYTMRYARAFTRTLAIEPNPATFHILQANIALGRATNVTPLLMGCSDKVGTAQLNVPVKGMLGWSRIGADADWDQYPIQISLDTVDNLVSRFALAERVALLKIDVEGHEPHVLKGASKTLAQHRPVVLYEAWSTDLAQASAEQLRAAGYNYFVNFSRPLRLAGAVTGLSVTAQKIEPSTAQKESLICAFHSIEGADENQDLINSEFVHVRHWAKPTLAA